MTALYDEVHNMSESQRIDLDPICYALADYQRKYPPRDGGRVVPNRVAALAAIKAAAAWESATWNVE